MNQTDITLEPEEWSRLRSLLEICDEEKIVNGILVKHGMMGPLAPGEFRFFPWSEENWLCLACLAKPLKEDGSCHSTTKCILRLPDHTGENGKRFMLGFVQHMATTEGPGFLKVAEIDCSGANN